MTTRRTARYLQPESPAEKAGLKAGDVQTMSITAPGGAVLAQTTSAPVPRDQAQRLMFVGGRLKTARWPAGEYQALYRVQQNGQTVLERRFSVKL